MDHVFVQELEEGEEDADEQEQVEMPAPNQEDCYDGLACSSSGNFNVSQWDMCIVVHVMLYLNSLCLGLEAC